jgi:hypothetical protein
MASLNGKILKKGTNFNLIRAEYDKKIKKNK